MAGKKDLLSNSCIVSFDMMLEDCSMNVDIEFFSDDPMDNVLACTKFQFDKVIFLGYVEEDMDRVAKSTVAAFLKSEEIGVQQIDFVAMPEGDLAGIKKNLAGIIEKEQAEGNECFFDLTGGEELILAAAGMVADEKKVPIHEVDLADDAVRIQSLSEKYEDLPKRNYYLSIEEYINLHEGVVESKMFKKKNREHKSLEHKKRVEAFSNFAERMGKKWNKTSLALANLCSKKVGIVYASQKDIKTAAKIGRIPPGDFLKILTMMQTEGLLKSCALQEGLLNIEFFNEWERGMLCEAGATLEHMTYWQIMKDPEVNDCVIGYHINWLGEGDPKSVYKSGPDILNEVDVIYMRKNIPTFVSCKNKLVTNNQPLYELETVADRFGGRLVKKILVAKSGTSEHISQRAKAMDIEVVQVL